MSDGKAMGALYAGAIVLGWALCGWLVVIAR
jgi:hypothetical protein